MKIVFSSHAEQRMKERFLEKGNVEKYIQEPNKTEISKKDNKRFLIKKIYYNEISGKDHLLIAICEEEQGATKVVTVLDTSKISKYF